MINDCRLAYQNCLSKADMSLDRWNAILPAALAFDPAEGGKYAELFLHGQN